jgi:hypothetical protein
LHAAGKTDEAKKDMARLAAIRKQREATKLAKDKEAAGEFSHSLGDSSG